MKQTCLAFLCIFIPFALFSQKKNKYIQINASVGVFGDINMLPLTKYDSLGVSDYEKLNKSILEGKKAITVINLLSNEGWVFVSAVYINKNEEGGPNTPFIAYYFMKPKE